MGKGANEPVISHCIKQFGVDVNIINGKIDYLKDEPLGRLTVGIEGSEESVRQVLQYLYDIDLRTEVIGYVVA